MVYWKEGDRGAAELITAAEVPDRLHGYARRAATPRVIIRSDTRSKLGPAVRVFDEVRKAGIKQVSIETTTSATGT
jgi:biopolymer transport protein ExbD